jgi:hypothetical protein
MIQDVLVVDASAHSYNLAEDNYAPGRYSRADQMTVGAQRKLADRREFVRSRVVKSPKTA